MTLDPNDIGGPTEVTARTVTVVMPVRDEQETVGEALASLAEQDLGAEHIQLLVYDGMSTDATRACCERWAPRAAWASFEVHENRERTVPHALNAGLAAATGEWFIRLDGRTTLSRGYLRTCLDWLATAAPLAAAGGRLHAVADGPMGEAVAATVTHPWGVGQGFRVNHQMVAVVPHHPFAVWRTDSVRDLGGFDPRLVRNQDDEFSMRAVKAGAQIWVLPTVDVTYRPRTRLRGLATQYFQYGLWKSAVGRDSGLFPLRSLAPAGVLGLAGGATVGALAGRRWPLVALTVAYGAAGWRVSESRPRAGPLRTAAALAILHLSYGAGVLAGGARPALAWSRVGRVRVR